MIKWMLKPKSKLVAKFVDCYWFLDKETLSCTHANPKLNPDPAATLILALENQAYSYDLGNQIYVGTGSHLILPYTKTMILDHSKPLQLIGIKFHIGAIYSLNIVQAKLDKILSIDLAQLLDMPYLNNANYLDEADINAESCCNMLDKTLTAWLSKVYQDKHANLCEQIVSLIDNTAISELGKKLNLSQRSIERNFLKVTGLTLKQCQSMNRLEAILAYLYQRKSENINWAQVAYQFGFSDQPHLIRYFKKVIGSTPEQYANLGGLAIDIYGGVDPKE